MPFAKKRAAHSSTYLKQSQEAKTRCFDDIWVWQNVEIDSLAVEET